MSSMIPSPSRISSVRACMPIALERSVGPSPLSTMRHSTPWRASSAASVRPVGPAPMTSTGRVLEDGSAAAVILFRLLSSLSQEGLSGCRGHAAGHLGGLVEEGEVAAGRDRAQIAVLDLPAVARADEAVRVLAPDRENASARRALHEMVGLEVAAGSRGVAVYRHDVVPLKVLGRLEILERPAAEVDDRLGSVEGADTGDVPEVRVAVGREARGEQVPIPRIERRRIGVDDIDDLARVDLLL